MTSKANNTVKPAQKKAAPKTASVAKPVEKVEAAAKAPAVAAPVEKVETAPKVVAVAKPVEKTETAPAQKPAQLVTKIVSVENKPSEKGITKMTNAAEKMTQEATAKAKDFFADIQVKATEAAEKGKKLAADATEFSKANVEAVVEAAKIAANGAQEMGKTNAAFAKANFEEMQAAVKELTAVKSPTDFVKLQGELARKGFDTAVAQTSKNTETLVKLVSDMFQPISNRIAVTTDLFKKAA